MMPLLWAGAGALAAGVLLRSTRGILQHPVLERQNYRGALLPTAAGLLVVIAVLAVEGAAALLHTGLGGSAGRTHVVMVLAVCAFAFLGLLDDLLGDGLDRGLKGHVRAALRGRLTTGFVKLAGGAAAALLLASASTSGSAPALLVDAALVALAANMANLLDRAPGRALKFALLAYVPVGVAAGASEPAEPLAAVMGAGAVLLIGDLRERFMLGDTGANAIGAALGLAVVLSTGPGVRLGLAVILLVLTLLSEFISFSRIIGAVLPLRAFDRWGRRPEGGNG